MIRLGDYIFMEEKSSAEANRFPSDSENSFLGYFITLYEV